MSDKSISSGWEKLAESIWMFRDSCNVYAVAGPEGLLVINAGTGRWLDELGGLPGPVKALACTHFFRDHSAGAAEAARRGIAVYAPYWEQEQFADPLGLFKRRETFIIYDNVWDLFAPIEPITVSSWLRDWDTLRLAGLEVQVLPSPGVTLGAVSLMVGACGRKVAFCGELISSPGRMARLAPLQYNYQDLSGAMNVIYSSRLLRRQRPDVLAPSLGQPMFREADSALAALEQTMRLALAGRPNYNGGLAAFDGDPLIKVTDHVYQSAVGVASTWFILSDSGKALAIDYGYTAYITGSPGYPYPRHRRTLLHGLDALKDRFGIDRLDVVMPTHFHDDHVNGIATLQRLHGTRCWAGENFADILANPMNYSFPCTWPEAVRVEPQPLRTPIQWEEYTFTLEPMSGHTRWSTLISFQADGKRFSATGDQYLPVNWEPTDFEHNSCMHNHVYRNGAMLQSFHQSNKALRSYQPEMILPGHGAAYATSEAFFGCLERYAEEYVNIHRQAMPLGGYEAHFEVDSRAAWLTPYRIVAAASRELRFIATIRNPLPTAASLEVCLVGPVGWKGSAASIPAGPRTEVTAELTILPPPGTQCRRQPIAMDLVVNGRPFGQVAEALVTIGHPVF